jgi:dATP pyrophosphohydrolase
MATIRAAAFRANRARNPSASYPRGVPSIKSNLVSCYVFGRSLGEHKFLLLRRSEESILGGTWQAVHGHIEAGETAVQTAVRELREETGFSPERLYRVEHVEQFYNERNDSVYFVPVFAAEVNGLPAPALSHEHTEFTWASLRDALSLIVWDNQRKSIGTIAGALQRPGRAEFGPLSEIRHEVLPWR